MIEALNVIAHSPTSIAQTKSPVILYFSPKKATEIDTIRQMDVVEYNLIRGTLRHAKHDSSVRQIRKNQKASAVDADAPSAPYFGIIQ
ncbi:hypothetical protein D3C84_607210 [compost metagenome]